MNIIQDSKKATLSSEITSRSYVTMKASASW